MNNNIPSYHRPTDTWRCGHVSACELGTDGNGRCPHSGGANNPTPCQPVRTLRAKKRMFIYGITGLCLALLTLFLASPNRLEFLSPGPLSLAHSEVAECQDCHMAAEQSIVEWVQTAVTLDHHQDDQRCVDCHEYGEQAFNPHTTSSSVLNTVSQKVVNTHTEPDWMMQLARSWNSIEKNNTEISTKASIEDNTERVSSTNTSLSSAGTLINLNSISKGEVSCTSCHREHQGKFHPIADFNEAKCQTCHLQTFSHFEDDHPEFTQYPFTQSTAIQFDHVSHMAKHFLDDDVSELAPESCKNCHEADDTGEWMLAKPFEETCSACHLNDIMGTHRATAKGINVLSIPEIDIASLQAAGYQSGEWPEWAEGGVPPIMAFLLKAQHHSAIDLVLNDSSLELYDLSEATDEQLASVTAFIWQIKKLLFDLESGGTTVMEERLEMLLGQSISANDYHALVAALPRDVLLSNQRQWFPNLEQEVTAFNSGKIKLKLVPISIQKTPSAVSTLSTANTVVVGGVADIEMTASSSQNEPLLEDELSINELLIDDNISLNDDDLMDGLGDDLSGILNDDLSDEESLEIDALDKDVLSDELLSDDDEPKTESVLIPKQVVSVNNEDWSAMGGWYRDGSAILYRPTGHKDSFFKAWLDVSTTHKDTLGKSILAQLAEDKAVGACTKCHTEESNTKSIHWESFTPNPSEVTFTRFSHSQHFGVLDQKACATCHKLSPSKQGDTKSIDVTLNGASISSIDIKNTVENASFLPIKKETCTQCHQPARAPTNCLTCHFYHAQKPEPWIEGLNDVISDGASPAQ